MWLRAQFARTPLSSRIVCARRGQCILSLMRQAGGGMSLIDFSNTHPSNPVDVVEGLASRHDWPFARASEDEVTIVTEGHWADYQLSFTWMSEIEALHLACAFNLRVPDQRRTEVIELVAMINERLLVGHFDYWSKAGLILYRHALVLAGGVTASVAQCEALLGTALDSCERYYQAFQFVVWAGKSAHDAMEATMFETSGEA
jgi:hypothetical protein